MRESELERAIADLGAALVVARNKEINRLRAMQNGDILVESDGNDISALRMRLEDAEDHVETLTAQLDLERQRVSLTVRGALLDCHSLMCSHLHVCSKYYSYQVANLASRA